jgi:hypothetical protein
MGLLNVGVIDFITPIWYKQRSYIRFLYMAIEEKDKRIEDILVVSPEMIVFSS